MMYQVLIVDDEELMREALRVMVSKVEGFQVVDCVGSGEDAVKICGSEKINIVFMDIMMPGISGIEASRAIYDLDSSVTIYIISACDSFEFVRGALRANVRDYISKPVSFSIIAELLEAYKQSQSVEETQLKILLQALERSKFKQIYTSIPQTVQKIFQQETKDKNNIKNCFVQLGQSVLMAVVDPLGEQMENIEGIFPINDVFVQESTYWGFWLFDVMNYTFQKSAISKCKRLQKVFRHIDGNIKEDINLFRITEDCGISQGYLSKLFKQYFGVSVMEYIHLIKIKHAKMYFAYTDMSMTDISFSMGYNEGSYFCKVFRKYEGLTPQQYKKMVNQQRHLDKGGSDV